MKVLGALALCIGVPAIAAAHGSPPVLSISDQDDAGPLALRLGQGMALRRGSEWRFICPTRFAGAAQDPADSLPGGGVAIGTDHGGLRIMGRDGAIVPHPDPTAADSHFVAFASSEAGLFGLRSRADLYDVVQVYPDRLRVVFTDTEHWSDIGIGDGYLLLVRFEGAAVETRTLSFEGEKIADAQAMLHETPVVSFARPIADTPYLVLGFVGAAYQLGRIDQGTWRIVQTAGGNLAGPLQTVDGMRFIAVEGALASFDAEMVMPRGDVGSFVLGLRRLGSRSYACTTDGVRDISSAGLGAQLFTFEQLLPPELMDLPDVQRMSCNLEWQHMLFELRSMNIAVYDPAKVPPATMGAAGAGGSSPTLAGSGGVSAAPTGGIIAPPPSPGPTPAAGCAISVAESGELPLAWALLPLAFALRRRRISAHVLGFSRPNPWV